jgi:hypothetical protein
MRDHRRAGAPRRQQRGDGLGVSHFAAVDRREHVELIVTISRTRRRQRGADVHQPTATKKSIASFE